MSSDHDETPDTPSTDLELVNQRVAWLRAELEKVQETAQRAVVSRPVGPLDEWVNVLKDYDQLGQALARTDFVPKDFRGKPEQVTAAMMYGREIGLPPLTTLQNTHVIHGRVGMYAEQLRAMILAAGHEYEIEESTSDRCVIAGRRKGSDRWISHTYTMDQAKLAGLYAQNEQYRKRPVEMLLARASGIMAHAQFPDVIRGMGALEEMDGVEPDAPAPAAEQPKATSTVQRKPRKAAAAIERTEDPSGGAVIREAHVIPDQPGLPPLPGEESAPATVRDEPTRRNETAIASGAAPSSTGSKSSPGEGEPAPEQGPAGDQGTPAGPAGKRPDDMTDAEYERFRQYRMSEPDNEVPDPDRVVVGGDLQCPHISNGVRCAWLAGHISKRHSYDDPDQPLSGPVAEQPKPISAAGTRMLQARFRALGYTDEPGDREARLAVAAALSGRAEVTTFGAGRPDSLTAQEAQAILTGLADCRNRDDVLELMVRRARDAEEEETSE